MNEIGQLVEVGRHLLSNQLAWGTSGNMSARLNRDVMTITASGTHMGNLHEDDFVECEILTGDITGSRKASKETPMHTGIYRNREDVGAILHSSPFYATMFACSDVPLESKLFVESMYYLENIAYVDYFHPGTQELADAIAEKSLYADIIIMRHHGVVVFDKTISEALVRLETLEMVCRMILQEKASGIELNMIPTKKVQDFLENTGYRQRRLPPKKI